MFIDTFSHTNTVGSNGLLGIESTTNVFDNGVLLLNKAFVKNQNLLKWDNHYLFTHRKVQIFSNEMQLTYKRLRKCNYHLGRCCSHLTCKKFKLAMAVIGRDEEDLRQSGS